jgi:hypothetical protein
VTAKVVAGRADRFGRNANGTGIAALLGRLYGTRIGGIED